MLFSEFPPQIDDTSFEFIASLGFFIVVAIAIMQCYSCSTCMLLSGYDVNRDHQIIKRRSSISTASHGVTSGRSFGDSQYGGSTYFHPVEAMKSRNLMTRKQTCEEQLKYWSDLLRNTEALMVSQADNGNNGSLAAITGARIVPHTEADNFEGFHASNKNSVERNVSAYTALSLSVTPSVTPMRMYEHDSVDQVQAPLSHVI